MSRITDGRTFSTVLLVDITNVDRIGSTNLYWKVGISALNAGLNDDDFKLLQIFRSAYKEAFD